MWCRSGDLPCVEQTLAGHSMSRADIGLSAKDVVLISVNRLAADKGVDKIITALGMIVQQVPQVKLIIIGSGYQEKELLEMIVQKGLTKHVRHFKNVLEEDLYQYYRISDIYLCAFSYRLQHQCFGGHGLFFAGYYNGTAVAYSGAKRPFHRE